MRKFVVVVFVLAFASVAAVGAPTRMVQPKEEEPLPVGFSVGYSPMFSFGMTKLFDDYYDESSGAFWTGIQLGAPIRFGDFAVFPAVAGFGNYVMGLGAADDFYNAMIVPSLALRYTLPGKHVRFHVAVDVAGTVPFTDSDDFDYTGGVGGGVAVGATFLKYAQVELGYEYLPVKVDAEGRRGEDIEDSYDFGGIVARIRFTL